MSAHHLARHRLLIGFWIVASLALSAFAVKAIANGAATATQCVCQAGAW